MGPFLFFPLPSGQEAVGGEETGAALAVATEVPGREPEGLLGVVGAVRGMLQVIAYVLVALFYSRVRVFICEFGNKKKREGKRKNTTGKRVSVSFYISHIPHAQSHTRDLRERVAV